MSEILVAAVVIYLPLVVLIGLATRFARPTGPGPERTGGTTTEEDGRWLRP